MTRTAIRLIVVVIIAITDIAVVIPAATRIITITGRDVPAAVLPTRTSAVCTFLRSFRFLGQLSPDFVLHERGPSTRTYQCRRHNTKQIIGPGGISRIGKIPFSQAPATRSHVSLHLSAVRRLSSTFIQNHSRMRLDASQIVETTTKAPDE